MTRTEFEASFGAQFPEVQSAPAPRDTERGDRLPLARPDGATNPDRTVSHYVNQITDFEFDDCVQGTLS